MTPPSSVLDAFEQESANVRELVAGLPTASWEAETPSRPWTVRDQVAHLAFVFDLAAMAAGDAASFQKAIAPTADIGFDAAVNQALANYNGGSTEDVLARFDVSVERARASLGSRRTDELVPWLVRPLPAAILTAAGMIELFAHGQDIADAVGEALPRTDTVAHLIPFIHRTIPFGYETRGLDLPRGDFAFHVDLPSGRRLDVGSDDAPNVIVGNAVDLALLATRRRHPDDLDIEVMGPDACTYLEVAQAYRGPAGPQRPALNPQGEVRAS